VTQVNYLAAEMLAGDRLDDGKAAANAASSGGGFVAARLL
jgi:hypothetical protein